MTAAKDIPLEDQVKSLTVSYPEFCLLIQAVSDAIAVRLASVERLALRGAVHLAADTQAEIERLRALYVTLGGEQ